MLTSYFDFNSAASSPKPPRQKLPRKEPQRGSLLHQQPHQFRSAFRTLPPFQAPSPPAAIDPQQALPTRKRSRSQDESDLLLAFPPVTVKSEFPEFPSASGGALPVDALQFPTSPPTFSSFAPAPASPAPPQPQPQHHQQQQQQFALNRSSAQSLFQSGPLPTTAAAADMQVPPTSTFQPKYQLDVEFPKHLKLHPDGRPHHVKSRVETQISVKFVLREGGSRVG